MSDKNEIDRWRRSLDEAEREIESKDRLLQDMQSFWCTTVSEMVHLLDKNDVLHDDLLGLKKAAKDFESLQATRKSIDDILGKLHQLRSSAENAAPEDERQRENYGSELLILLEALEEATPEPNTLVELKKQVIEIKSDSDLQQIIEQVVTLWTHPNEPSSDPSQFCALLISEILYQLLEKISLPKDVSERLGGLKKQLQQGVTMSKWAGMLTEVSDMASFVQLKINRERLDIEVFLKQVTGRLKELDDYIQGSKKHIERTQINTLALGDAVKLEMQNLVSSANTDIDLNSLKNQIQSGLAAIEKHIDGFKQAETVHHSDANNDVQKLLGRLAKLEEESAKLKARVQKERMQAQIDTLTGIANRLGYDHHIAQEYARWKRFGNPLSLVVWDIDHFKRINDDYGHAAGDKALKTIASLLASKVRETDYLARYGGEEFVLIMPGASLESAKLVAEKLRETVENSGFHFKGAPVQITISAGIAEFVKGDSPSTVFERADKALYEAKQNGRNQVVVAN